MTSRAARLSLEYKMGWPDYKPIREDPTGSLRMKPSVAVNDGERIPAIFLASRLSGPYQRLVP
jgi:hypothetical protein